jgi:hypothetical protein
MIDHQDNTLGPHFEPCLCIGGRLIRLHKGGTLEDGFKRFRDYAREQTQGKGTSVPKSKPEAKPAPMQPQRSLLAPEPGPTPPEDEENRKKRMSGKRATLLGAY